MVRWRNLHISVGSEKIRANFANKAPTKVDQEEQLATSRGCLFKSADLSLTRVALSCVYLKIIGDLEWKSEKK